MWDREGIVIHPYCFVLVPPVPCAENKNICSNPVLGEPVELVELNCGPDVAWCILRWMPYRDEEGCPVIFNCEVVVLESHGEETFVLCNGVPLYFIDSRLVGYCFSKHAQQRFPLVPSDRVTGKHYSSIPASLQEVTCVKPVSQKSLGWVSWIQLVTD